MKSRYILLLAGITISACLFSQNFNPNVTYGSVTDVDGNVYKTVQIGDQTWMAENLKVTKFNDDIPIPFIENNIASVAPSSPAYCWYKYDETYKNPYGALYNWSVVNTGKLCPITWHVPTDIEWSILNDYLGGYKFAGDKMKETGLTHWATLNNSATNESGFTAVPSEVRWGDGSFNDLGYSCTWWSSTEYEERGAFSRGLWYYDSSSIFRNFDSKADYISIRCINSNNDSTFQIDLNKGLVAYFPFNGNANDESGNSHDGVVDGAVLTTDRYSSSDKAYYFNGQGNSIAITDINIPSDSVTITCWAKVMSPATSQILISKNSGPSDVELLIKSINNRYTIEWTIGGHYFILTDDHGYYPIDPYQPEFAFLVLSHNGQKVNFYVNNQLVASRNISGTIAKSMLPMVFGRFAGGKSPENFNGKLDDVRIYDRVLKEEEIKALFYEFKNQSPFPQVTTMLIKDIKSTTAWSGGLINSDGGSEVILKGVCWSSSTDPDTSDFIRTVQGGIYEYSSFLTDLKPNTYYFVKAYAINQTGIGYGNQLCFKTMEDGSVNLQNGLVTYYSFEGNAKDESGNGYDGVVQGASLTYDRYGNNHSSYLFDTNNATIQLPNDVLNDLPNASISVWVYWIGERPSIIMAKQHDGVDSYYIFGIGMYNIGGGVDVGDTGRIYFRVKNSSQTLMSNSLLERNKWNHLVITIDQELKLYINGILDAEISGSDFVLPDDLNATLTSLGIWLQDVTYSGVMNGNLDDIRIYNRAISNAEIKALYSENGISDSGLTNLALHKPVTQSSTKYGGVAERAVDGNPDGLWNNGSISHTGNDFNAWLEIDLGGIYNINTIELWNRTDICCMSRLSDFYVFASDEPFVSKKLQNTLNQPGIWHIHETGFPNPADTFSVVRTGRYIRIQLKHKAELNIAEVKVIGSLNPVLSNIALNKPVIQSSTQYGGVPERAVDGNTNGLWSNRSVTHTNRDKNAWWELDLGRVYDVSSIELWNRADNCCKSRLSDYYVFASEVPFGSRELNATLSQSNIWFDHQNEYPDPVQMFNLNRSVRYVRVQSAGYTELNIAEVKVMGAPNESTFKSTGERYMEENKEISGITIYPVPFTEHINVKSEEIIDRVELYNVLGELLITREFNDTNATLDTDYLEPGYYVIRIKTNKGVVKTYSVIKRN